MTNIIFDLDDTLIDTSDLFWNVREQFLEVLNLPDTPREVARETFENEDTLSIELFGYLPDRYQKTMLKVYKNSVDSGILTYSQNTEFKIKEIGSRIITEVPKLISGAKSLLATLKKDKRNNLTLLTRGSEEAQNKKILFHGLEDFFGENIFITQRKNVEVFKSVMDEINAVPEDTWVIGDSIRSDINPGLETGVNCIHYLYKHHTYHWIQEHGDVAISDDYFEASNLSSVYRIIKKTKFASNFDIVQNNFSSVRPSMTVF